MNLKSLIGKLNPTSRGALEGAAGLCLARTHYDIEVEHVLHKLLDVSGNDTARIFRHYGVDTSRFQRELEKSLDNLKTGNARTPAISPQVIKMMTEAWNLASLDFNADLVRSGFMILALVSDPELARMIKEVSSEIRKIPADALKQDLGAIVKTSSEETDGGAAEGAAQSASGEEAPKPSAARRPTSISSRST